MKTRAILRVLSAAAPAAALLAIASPRAADALSLHTGNQSSSSCHDLVKRALCCGCASNRRGRAADGAGCAKKNDDEGALLTGVPEDGGESGLAIQQEWSGATGAAAGGPGFGVGGVGGYSVVSASSRSSGRRKDAAGPAVQPATQMQVETPMHPQPQPVPTAAVSAQPQALARRGAPPPYPGPDAGRHSGAINAPDAGAGVAMFAPPPETTHQPPDTTQPAFRGVPTFRQGATALASAAGVRPAVDTAKKAD